MSLPINKILCGDCLEKLKEFPAESINCCISSPPYWALRDYGVDGQLGLEPTFEEYIDRLCNIYDEVKRVLRKDGTCWVNLGDTYWGSGRGPDKKYGPGRDICPAGIENAASGQGYIEKCLCLIPDRFRIEIVNRGWIIRNKIIWHKLNPMPSSAKDRFTVDFEDVIFMTKSPRYWFEPQYEPLQCPERLESRPFDTDNFNRKQQYDGKSLRGQGINPNTAVKSFERIAALGRNKRCVWTIPTQPYSQAHFATFPEKLVEPMIKAGCPEFVCTKCGKAREKIYEPTVEYKKLLAQQYKISKEQERKIVKETGKFGSASRIETYFNNMPAMTRQVIFKGYTDCGCGEKFRPGIMLDPFVVRAQLAKLLPN